MGELAGRAVEGDATLVVDQDRVVEFKMSEGVGHKNDGATVVAGKIVEEVNDFAFGAGIESTCDLVTQEELGIRDELHGESETPFLSAREHPDVAVGNGSEASLLQNTVNALIELLGIAALDAETGGSLDRFIDRELVVGDGELGDVADLPGFEIALLGEIPPVPPEGASGFGIEASDGFQESGLATTRGAYNGHEMSPWYVKARVVYQINGFAIFLNSETDLLELEHD